MQTQNIEAVVAEATERLNNAREFNWTGGFEQHFFEDWLRAKLTTHTLAAEERHQREVEALVKEMLNVVDTGVSIVSDSTGKMTSKKQGVFYVGILAVAQKYGILTPQTDEGKSDI